jgi:hypothetical protein
MAPPEVAGRQWDFPSGYNLGLTPRQYEPIGFGTLRAIAESYDILRAVIETRKDQVARMTWNIKARDPKMDKAPGVEAKCKVAKDFFERPDGVNVWPEWIRMILEDLFVIDAPTLYKQRTRAGKLFRLHPIDGATIVPKVDDWGRRPQPYVNEAGQAVIPVAYQQVLKGIPAIDYSVNDLFYRPRNMRPSRTYGYGPVEQIMTTINIALRRQLFLLDYYTDGNIPDSIATVPDGWSPEQIRKWQDTWDSYFVGNLANRRRMKFVPGGAGKFQQTKEPELKNEFDEWLTKIVCFAFSISAQPFMRVMSRANGETQKEMAEEEGLAPILDWIKSAMDDFLSQEFDSAELEFVWEEDKEVDEQVQEAIITSYVSKGLYTINEGRAKLGMDPLPNPAADLPMVMTATGFVLIEANTIEGKQQFEAAFPNEAAPDPVAMAQAKAKGAAAANPKGNGSPPGGKGAANPKAGKAVEDHTHAVERLAFNKAAGRRPGPVPFPAPPST